MTSPDCWNEPYRCLLPECINRECVLHWYALRRREHEMRIVAEYEHGAETVDPPEEFL